MIDWRIKLVSVISLLIVIFVITYFVRKNKITVRYSIIWYLSLILLMIFSIFPEILGWLAKLVGFEMSSNLLFVLLIAFLMFI